MCSEITDMYKTCRKIDAKLGTEHFQDPKLKKLIATIREQLKSDRARKISLKVDVCSNG